MRYRKRCGCSLRAGIQRRFERRDMDFAAPNARNRADDYFGRRRAGLGTILPHSSTPKAMSALNTVEKDLKSEIDAIGELTPLTDGQESIYILSRLGNNLPVY